MHLSISGVSTGYGAAQALYEISMGVDREEIVSVLGANGAGKTTTLRVVSGIIPTWSGNISLGGRPLDGYTPEARARLGLGHVPEGRGILKGLTVGENLHLGVLRGHRGARALAEVRAQLLDLFDPLADRLNEQASSLSGGQQQMLALARTLMRQPDVVMIDELSLGLSPALVKQFYQFVSLLREQGTAFLIVEQHAGVLDIADRAYVLAHGHIVLETNTPKELNHEGLLEHYFAGAKRI